MAIVVFLLKCYQIHGVDCTSSCLAVNDMVKVINPKVCQNNILSLFGITGNIELFSACCALIAWAVSVSQVELWFMQWRNFLLISTTTFFQLYYVNQELKENVLQVLPLILLHHIPCLLHKTVSNDQHYHLHYDFLVSGFKRYVKKSVTGFGGFLSSDVNSSGVGGHFGSGSWFAKLKYHDANDKLHSSECCHQKGGIVQIKQKYL